ncbi:hypothetical protein Tco_1098474, partial [Tanacetum coccineum]
LETDGEMCMFALTVSRTEPKNIKEAMAHVGQEHMLVKSTSWSRKSNQDDSSQGDDARSRSQELKVKRIKAQDQDHKA